MVISLSFGSRVFSTTSLNNPVPDLFGSISVDDGVEHGRYQEIENSKHYMYYSGHMISQAVGEESKESRDIKPKMTWEAHVPKALNWASPEGSHSTVLQIIT